MGWVYEFDPFETVVTSYESMTRNLMTSYDRHVYAHSHVCGLKKIQQKWHQHFFCWLNLEGVPPPEVGAEEDVGNWATQRLPRCWALSPWQSEKHPLHFRIKYPSYSIWMDVSDVSTWHWHGLLQTVLNNVGLSVLQDSCVYFILMTEMFVR
jgi:hypothetical protein